MIMEFSTVILRFRDLVTEKDATIGWHKEIIKNKNYVWWGWWNKGNERVPYDEFSVLKGRINGTLDLYLIDSGQKKLYKAQCCDMKYTDEEKIKSPEIDHTPDYYNNQSYYAWFKLNEIQECDNILVHNLSYVDVPSVYVESNSNYTKFNDKRIYNVQEMIQQNRTLWFVRNYEEGKDSDYEISLLDASVVEPHDFSASEGFISDVMKIMPQMEDWQNRPLSEVYPVLFMDAIHYSVRDNGIIRKLAA